MLGRENRSRRYGDRRRDMREKFRRGDLRGRVEVGCGRERGGVGGYWREGRKKREGGRERGK